MSSKVADGQYVGTTRLSRRVGGITLAETDYEPGLAVPSHAHASGLCALMLRGAMTEQRGHRKILCEAGTLIFQPPDEAHAHRFLDAGGSCFIVQLGDPWIRRMRRLELDQPDSPLALRNGKAVWLTRELHREARTPDDAADLAIEGLALSLLGELTRSRERRERSVKPGWLTRAVEILHDRAGESLEMAEIAEAVGVHPVHLSRSFSAHYGCTMGEYLRRLRVERARAALAGTDKPLSQVAYECGFSDQAHFTRVFKQITGVTPGSYRRDVASR